MTTEYPTPRTSPDAGPATPTPDPRVREARFLVHQVLDCLEYDEECASRERRMTTLLKQARDILDRMIRDAGATPAPRRPGGENIPAAAHTSAKGRAPAPTGRTPDLRVGDTVMAVAAQDWRGVVTAVAIGETPESASHVCVKWERPVECFATVWMLYESVARVESNGPGGAPADPRRRK